MSEPNYIVGIGASAGGLEAIESFFRVVPENSGMAYVVVQHLSPDHKSLMVELLTKKTNLPVKRIEDQMKVEADHIYLIPPGQNLTIFHGKLQLRKNKDHNHLNLPIDLFFHSLAEDQGHKAVAVILSGTGSDGTRGIRSIKEYAGLVIVQDETTAKFDGMPRSAISTGLVDLILSPEVMSERLVAMLGKRKEQLTPEAETRLEAEADLTRVFALLRKSTSVDFTFYKPSTIYRRIERRMALNSLGNLGEYYEYLLERPAEVSELYKELLINVTCFFRDPQSMEVVRNNYLPEILEKDTQRELRFWVAGCSTGEEAYTLGILIREEMEKKGVHRDIKIFATDLDKDAILTASAGIYPESIAADVPPELLKKYFYQREGGYHVARQIREMVVFAQHNLVKDAPFTNIDLISCRNLLIYLQPVLQETAMSMFNFALSHHGILFLGSSETVGKNGEWFECLDQKHKIFRTKGKSRLPGQALLQARSGGGQTQTKTAHPTPMYMSQQNNVMREETVLLNRMLDVLGHSFLPLTLIVNENLEVIHILGDSEGVLKVSSGALSRSLNKLVSKELAIPLTTGIQKVFRSQNSLNYHQLPYTINGKSVQLTLQFEMFPDKKGYEKLVAVFIQVVNASGDRIASQNDSGESQTHDEQLQQQLRDMEQELQFTRENLQATIEELETSNEELQATNEELLASNEELQSTNEELHSTNEELHTVNSEYQTKITELSELNNDVDNLLTSSKIGKILLDEDLVIRRFSPQVREIFHILEKDIGRPLEHISHRILAIDPLQEIRKVLQLERLAEHEIECVDGKSYLMRIIPYVIAPETFSGVVVTFVDVTERLQTEKAYIQTLRQFQDVVENMPAGLFIYQLNDEGNLALESNNNEAEKLTGISARIWKGHSFYKIWPDAKKEQLQEKLIHVMQTGIPLLVENAPFIIGDTKLFFRLRAFAMPDSRLAVSFEDRAEIAQVQSDLKLSEDRNFTLTELLQRAEETAKMGSWHWEVATDRVWWSPQLFDLFGLPQADQAPDFAVQDQLYTKDSFEKLASQVQKAVETGESYSVKLMAIRSDGSQFPCIASGKAERDETGQVFQLYGSLQNIEDFEAKS